MAVYIKPEILELITKLISLLQRTYQHGIKTGGLLSKKEIPFEVFMVIHAFERITERVNSISYLLEKIKESYYVEHSIGLLMRAIILESMNLLYLREQLKTLSDEEFEALFKGYIASQLKPMQGYVHYMKEVNAI